jgi:hypothetical protein
LRVTERADSVEIASAPALAMVRRRPTVTSGHIDAARYRTCPVPVPPPETQPSVVPSNINYACGRLGFSYAGHER